MGRVKQPRGDAVGRLTRWLEDELPFGKLMDTGIVEYREFACSRRTLAWLDGGAMRTVDGSPVRLWVADVCPGGRNVIVQARDREAA